MKHWLSSKVWWEEIDKDAEKAVKSCRECQLSAKNSGTATFEAKLVATRPVGIDSDGFNGTIAYRGKYFSSY